MLRMIINRSSFRFRFYQTTYHRQYHRYRSEWSNGDGHFTKAPLLALPILMTFKHMLGIEDYESLDKDSLKAKIKQVLCKFSPIPNNSIGSLCKFPSGMLKDKSFQSWLYRKHGRRKEAIDILHEALREADDRRDPLIVTRVRDELANTYYEMGALDEAERLFRDVLQRLLQLHQCRERHPAFISCSLKLADIFALRNDLASAEIGYRHCVTKQLEVVNEHLKKHSVAHGAWIELSPLPTDNIGLAYTEPFALFGMCLEAYASFLMKYKDESRIVESKDYMDEAVKISHRIYGTPSAHTVNMLNNYATICLQRHRFDVAAKYLAICVNHALQLADCAAMLPGYYCNYAESLFHIGRVDEAIGYAQKAVQLSTGCDAKMQRYAETFLRDMQNDYRRSKKTRTREKTEVSAGAGTDDGTRWWRPW